MARRSSTQPTEAELEILSVLWRRGPATVREVHELLQEDRRTAMTTTLKILQVMAEKGLVTRSNTRPHVYAAAQRQEATQAGLVSDLVRRAFDGSVQSLLVRAVSAGDLSRQELTEIRQLINAASKGGKRGGA